MTDNQKCFLELVKAGLFPSHDEGLVFPDCTSVNWGEVYKLAEEQSVVGLVAAGIDSRKIQDSSFKCPQEWALQFIGSSLQLEQQNVAMNSFIAELIETMRKRGIYTLLVKGQGVAQCYEKPLWRASGDVDLFLSEDNYNKARDLLLPLSSEAERESLYDETQEMTIQGWVVELHGNLRSGLSARIDNVMDLIKHDTFYSGIVRSWMNGRTQVFLMGVENDVLFVFTHLLKHFYKGGLGLRQVCDWTRILWTYREKLDQDVLERRLRQMGLMSEWRVFGAYAVEYLGMDASAVPFLNLNGNHDLDSKLKRKVNLINRFILDVGNMGHNRDTSYMKYPFVIRKIFSAGRRISDLLNHARIFPMDSLRFFWGIMTNGMRSALRGEG